MLRPDSVARDFAREFVEAQANHQSLLPGHLAVPVNLSFEDGFGKHGFLLADGAVNGP